MIDLAISIIDRLIQLTNVRKSNREKFFNEFIEPLYKDSERIAQDYLGLFSELVHRLNTDHTNAAILDWLEERRTILQPVRVKVRALLENGAIEHRTTGDDPLHQFERGIWGLMKGGVSLAEDGHAPAWGIWVCWPHGARFSQKDRDQYR